LILDHNNAPAYPSLQVPQCLAEGISAMDHQPYSPDFCLFPELKSVLKGKSFSEFEDIKPSAEKI
jgi:hypothetical protein